MPEDNRLVSERKEGRVQSLVQEIFMSAKMGSRETGRKPVSTRRHDSLADGAFGRETPAQLRSGEELNRKISGEGSKQHSKYKTRSGKKNV